MSSAESPGRFAGRMEIDPHDPRSYLEFLAASGARLLGSLDRSETASTLLTLALDGLADYAVIDLFDRDRIARMARARVGGPLDLHHVQSPAAASASASAHTHAPHGEHTITFSTPLFPDEILARVGDFTPHEASVVSGTAEELARLLVEEPEELRALASKRLERVVALPLDVEDGRLGVLWLAAANPYSLCTLADLRLACELASLGSSAIHNATLHGAAREMGGAARNELDHIRQAMQRIEVRMQRLFEAEVFGITFSTLDGLVVDANQAFLKLVGYTREDLAAGMVCWSDMTPPEFLERSHAAVDEVRRLGVFTPFEKEYIRKDGSRVAVLIGGARIEGSDTNAVTFVIDLTEQKRAEHALRRREEEQRHLLQAIPDIIFHLTTDGVFLDVMAADDQPLLMPREEFLGRSVTEVLDAEIADPILEGLERLARTGEVEVLEYSMMMQGAERFYEARFAPSREGEALAIVRDITDRKRAEREVRASERRFRAVLENNWDGIWLLDSDGTILYGSPSIEHILGYTSEELMGRSCFEMIHPDDIDRVRASFTAMTQSPGMRVELEYRKMHRSGEWRWIEGSCLNLLDDPGVGALVGNFRDVTERRRSKEELTERVRQQAVVASFGQRALSGVDARMLLDEAVRIVAEVLDIRFAKVLELLPDGRSFLITAGVGWEPGVVGGTIVTADPESQAGYTLAASEPVVVENLPAETRFRGTPVLHTHGVVSGISVIIHGKDHPFGILGAHSGTMRRFSNDDIHFLQSIANILGEALSRQEAEEALHSSEKHYRALIENSYDATALIAADGAIVYASPSTTRVLGYQVDELVGSNLFELLHPEDGDTMARVVDDLLSRPGATLTTQYRMRHRDGRWRWVEGTGTNFTAEDGRRMVIANYHDVTERREWEGELRAAKNAAEAANAAKDQFLAVLSHELRTPLTPVLATVEALYLDPEFPEPLRDYMEIIRRNVDLEARLIDDLLDLTRIARGKLQLNRQMTDLHALVKSAEGICRGDAANKGVEIRLELEARRHAVNGDPARLQQVLWNLLQNAVKFTPSGGTIIVRSSNPSPERIRVEVSDTGIGIDSEILDRIFDAFEQGERTITRRFGGLGLGLAISRALVEMHEGTIEAASEGLDRGATFTIELAAAGDAPGSDADADEDAVDASARTIHILLVDDHHDTNLVMKLLLERHGYRVTTADSVTTALEEARRGAFDLVVSDIGLPDGSGLDLMRALVAMGLEKGIALSGFGMEEDLRRSREAGFQEHLIKPVSFQRLLQAVEKMLGESQ